MQLVFGASTTGSVASTGELDQLHRAITAASRWADRRINGNVESGEIELQVYSESLPAYGHRGLMVSRVPLVKVLRLFDSTATCDANEYCSTDYTIRSRSGGIIERTAGFAWTGDRFDGATPLNLGLTPAYRAESVSRPWLVEYVAGYKVSGSTSTAMGLSTDDENWTTGPTLPDDIAFAVAVRAAELYANHGRVVRRKVGDLDVTYSDKVGLGESAADSMLDPYNARSA